MTYDQFWKKIFFIRNWKKLVIIPNKLGYLETISSTKLYIKKIEGVIARKA